MDRIDEEVYNGSDNQIVILLFTGDDPERDLSGVTRAKFTVGGVTVDSDVPGDAGKIVWDEQITYDDLPADVVKLKLGTSSITPGSYTNGCLKLYDVTNTNGITYFRDAKITVYAACDA